MKARRQALILDLLDREPIASQQVLERRLRARGIRTTQATISRDLKELGLLKRSADGAYQRPAGEPGNPETAAADLHRAVRQYLTSSARVRELLVLKTGAGQAAMLALAIDRAALPAVLGTIAGDDTILVVCRTPRQAHATARRLDRLAAS
jgi:transcriptional regulator of arginine metabolism